MNEKLDPLEKIFREFPGMWHFRKKISEITIDPLKKIEIDLRAQTTLCTHPNSKNKKQSLAVLGDELLAIIRDDEKKER